LKQLSQTAGFTLIELLIALAVVAIAFTSLWLSLHRNAQAILYLQDKTAAHACAMNAAYAQILDLPIPNHEQIWQQDFIIQQHSDSQNWVMEVHKANQPTESLATLFLPLES
jgi:type II secretion system protein I